MRTSTSAIAQAVAAAAICGAAVLPLQAGAADTITARLRDLDYRQVLAGRQEREDGYEFAVKRSTRWAA